MPSECKDQSQNIIPDKTGEIFDGLNDEQVKAVRHDTGPLLIVAGAGTGKTTVITRRIANLITTKKARASEILALTFTDKAAAEMEERVDILVPYGFNDVWVSTFHAFGDRIIRENALELGLSSDYHLLTPPEQAVFFRENLFNFQLRHYRPLGNPAQYIRAMLALISRAKDEDIQPQEYLRYAETLFQKASSPEEKEEAEKQLEVARAYQKYDELKERHNALDFGDQVTKTLKLFREHPAVLKKYQERFRYLLVDEFQDTNFSQFEIVKLLAGRHKNITVVGDDDQSVYKFRGACLSNILHFKETYPECEQVVLRRNYRSTQVILDAAYKLITQNNPERLEVKNKINKELQALRVEGPAVKHLHVDVLSKEADEVARIIREKHDAGRYGYSDFAILVRANDSAIPFLKSLNMLDIPWRFSGNQGLYQREEIRLILAFLRVMADPEDSASLHYLASSDLYRFKPRELSLLHRIASYYRRSLSYVLRHREEYQELSDLSDETKAAVLSLLTDLDEYYAIAQDARTGELLYKFLKKTKIMDKLYSADTVREIERAQNIAQFFRIVNRFNEAAPYDRVTRFIEHTDSLLTAGDDPSVDDMDGEADAVNVLTVHKAKGLEFPVVFMVSMVENRFPSREHAETIELPKELIKDILPGGDFHIQEERRLCYVGMTRAKDELYFTSARDYGGKRPRKISRFVLEALDKPQADISVFKSSLRETLERFAPVSEAADRKLDLPLRSGMLTLSPYSIDDYLTCPMKYKYVHVLKVPVYRHHSVVFGDVVHRVLRQYYSAKKDGTPFGADDVLKYYKQFWSSAGFLSRQHEEERFRSGQETLLNYFHAQEKTGIVPLSVEEEFRFLFDKHIRIAGRWDRLDDRGGERVIVDFKTTGKIKTQKQADKEITKSRQLVLYALGYQMKYGALPGSLELHFIESGLVARLEPAPEMLEALKKDIRTVAEGILGRIFGAKPAYHACQYCAYSNICPAQETGGQVRAADAS